MDEHLNETDGHVYTPAELNLEVKLLLESGFPRILLEAEVSNLSRPASGHLYFSLKDDTAQVRCAMFRPAASRCRLELANGNRVLARGRISLYEARGDCQFIVDGLRDAGAGLLQAKFELLKKKLAAEGLFDADSKSTLPPYPLRIGIITSASGAAIQDIRHVLRRRWPVAEARLYPVAVQGAEAPAEICAALATAGRERWAELLILGRGGGSLEDLQAFNEESVARAVAVSPIPVISAVGHETDFSICDFVADLRAPTPSAAAELAVPDQVQLSSDLARFNRILEQRLQSGLQHRMQGLDHLAHRLAQRDPALRLREQRKHLEQIRLALQRAAGRRTRELRQRLADLSLRLELQHPGVRLGDFRRRLLNSHQAAKRLMARELNKARLQAQDLARTLHAVSPLATMGRGYAVLSSSTGELITTTAQVESGYKVRAHLSDGRLYCTVDSVSTEALLGSAEGKKGGPI